MQIRRVKLSGHAMPGLRFFKFLQRKGPVLAHRFDTAPERVSVWVLGSRSRLATAGYDTFDPMYGLAERRKHAHDPAGRTTRTWVAH